MRILVPKYDEFDYGLIEITPECAQWAVKTRDQVLGLVGSEGGN